MGTKRVQPWAAGVWELAARQHGVVSRAQLLELGMGAEAIRHRLRAGRLHSLGQGIYAVGRPRVTVRGRWMAAVLICGPEALLSHRSAAGLWGLLPRSPDPIEVIVPADVAKRRPDIRVYRQVRHLFPRRRRVDGIPVTDPVSTLIDIATCVSDGRLMTAVNAADHLELVDPERLRQALDSLQRRPGVRRLRVLLDFYTCSLPQSKLERRFHRLTRAAGLTLPRSQVYLNGHRVDFYWPEAGLVIECDSLRYHRSAAKQAADQRRDHDHISAGLTCLRFSHGQVRYEPAYVGRVLAANLERLRARG
jgi:very-short-patch-repair endonuclease